MTSNNDAESAAARVNAPLNRTRAVELLVKHKPTLMQRYSVTSLALFGSTARDVARSTSDIDILVAFDGPATSEHVARPARLNCE